MKYQLYGIDKNGLVTHAGTKNFRSLTIDKVHKYQRQWENWRKKYLKQNPGNYPLRTDNRETVLILAHKIGEADKMLKIPLTN